MDAYLVIDLEGTCSEDESLPRAESETIEVGAVILSPADCVRLRFTRFVRPVVNPVLTEFCTELTTITQADVDRAETFPPVFRQLLDFAEPFHLKTFYSWGTYDRDQLVRDCQRHEIAYPFRFHVDMAKLFRQKTGRKRGSRGALRYFGIEPSGARHRGMDHASDYSKMIPLLV